MQKHWALSVFFGNSKEGIGIATRIYLVNTKEDIDAGKDKVLKEAIEELKQRRCN